MQHEHAAYKCTLDMEQGHAASISQGFFVVQKCLEKLAEVLEKVSGN
jgi:hypothetical protein